MMEMFIVKTSSQPFFLLRRTAAVNLAPSYPCYVIGNCQLATRSARFIKGQRDRDRWSRLVPNLEPRFSPTQATSSRDLSWPTLILPRRGADSREPGPILALLCHRELRRANSAVRTASLSLPHGMSLSGGVKTVKRGHSHAPWAHMDHSN